MKIFAALASVMLLASAVYAAATQSREDWFDAKRNRSVPVRMMMPTSGKAPYPVVIFSHGLGGSRDGASYLGDAWTAAGYFVIYVQHPGSDTAVWSSAMSGGRQAIMASMRGAANGKQLVSRAQDIHFVIDELTRRNQSDPRLKGKLDLARIAMTGHSFGAGTALAIAGQQFGPSSGSLQDSRIKCAVYFSPPVAAAAAAFPRIFANISVPGFVMTGTEDTSPIGNTTAESRRIPFDAIAHSDQYLVNFNGGDHMIFSGRLQRNDKDLFFQPRIVTLSTAFLDAYLRGDEKQKSWLRNDAQKYLGESAKFESK
jgi:predicted dienelactone hydrolase